MALGTVIYVSAKPALGGRTITEVQELLGCDLASIEMSLEVEYLYHNDEKETVCYYS